MRFIGLIVAGALVFGIGAGASDARAQGRPELTVFGAADLAFASSTPASPRTVMRTSRSS